MQISIKGRRIVGIRTTYDSTKKRGVGAQVISFKSWLNSLDEIRRDSDKASQQLDALRDEEREQLATWLSQRSSDREKASNKSSLYSLERQLDLALSALSTQEGQDSLSSDLATRLYRKVRDLQQAMKKLGHARPKAE